MADQKISDMTAATSVGNADLVPIVQSGLNKKATREQLLTSDPMGGIVLVALGGGTFGGTTIGGETAFQGDASGFILTAPYFSYNWGPGYNSNYTGTSDGGWYLSFETDTTCQVFDNSARVLLSLDSLLEKITITANLGVFVTYIASVPSDWATSPPADMNTAINRLASAVRILRGSPIP